MSTITNEKILYTIISRYALTEDEKQEFLGIIMPIYIHSEFQRRMTREFLHHGNITLGEHILATTIITYIMIKRNKRRKNLNIALVLKISIFHDLYTLPWQNSPIKNKKFCNFHGFRHPIEGVINAITWFPKSFEDEEEARIIIDGIIHHMYPLPVVRYIEGTDNHLELRNFELISNLSDFHRQLLIESSSRGRIGNFSIAPSIYPEGKITCYADKRASISDFKINDISSITALVTGKNKALLKRKNPK